MASQRSSGGISLANRPGDWFYIVAFIAFAAFSFLVEPAIAFGDGLRPDSWNPLVGVAYEYATAADPVLIERPLVIRAQAALATLVFGPLYLLMAHAFLRGRSWVRVPALTWAVAITGLTVYNVISTLNAGAQIDGWLLSAGSLPFILVPVAVMVRMRKSKPFGESPAIEPCLPKDAPDPEARRRALEATRGEYAYHPPHAAANPLSPIAVAKRYPRSAAYDLRWARPYVPMVLGGIANVLVKSIKFGLQRLTGSFDKKAAYLGLFNRSFEAPSELVETHMLDGRFARERIDGPNSVLLARVTSPGELQDKLPISDQQFQSVVGGTRTLQDEVQANNLFLLDYALLARSTLPVEKGGPKTREKHFPAPVALFCCKPGVDPLCDLLPVAIKLDRAPDSPIYLKGSGHAWEMAKLYVQAADHNMQVMSTHLHRHHYVAEPFAISTPRQLADDHPIHLLLEPHLRYTIATNKAGFGQFTSPRSVFARIFAGSIAETRQIMISSHEAFSFRRLALPRDLEERKVTEFPSEYPYRDDGLLLWNAIRGFVDEFVRLFYRSDQDVAEDHELQAWMAELTDPEAGALRDLSDDGTLTTIEQLVDLAAQIIFTVGPSHASAHYPDGYYGTYIPAYPAATYRPPPQDAGQVTPEWLGDLLPPIGAAALQWLTHRVGAYHFDRFGDYSAHRLGRVAVAQRAIEKFNDELRRVEDVIRKRNETRAVPYVYMLPSQIPNSISV